jgi:hypothetical protein
VIGWTRVATRYSCWGNRCGRQRTASTLDALSTGSDPVEASLAAGSLVLPNETRTEPLLIGDFPGSGHCRQRHRLPTTSRSDWSWVACSAQGGGEAQ